MSSPFHNRPACVIIKTIICWSPYYRVTDYTRLEEIFPFSNFFDISLSTKMKKKTNWTILNCTLTFVLIIRIGDFQSYSNEIDACHKMCSHYIIFCCELVRCLHKTRARWFLYWIIHWNSRDNQLLPTLDSSV